MKTRDMRTLEEKILDIWAEHVNGTWHHTIVLGTGKTKVVLEAPGETFEYKTIKEAADNCLYTIGEWLKEV